MKTKEKRFVVIYYGYVFVNNHEFCNIFDEYFLMKIKTGLSQELVCKHIIDKYSKKRFIFIEIIPLIENVYVYC